MNQMPENVSSVTFGHHTIAGDSNRIYDAKNKCCVSLRFASTRSASRAMGTADPRSGTFAREVWNWDDDYFVFAGQSANTSTIYLANTSEPVCVQ